MVIAIIALLIGLLLPALNVARGEARKAVCLANLRSVGQVVTLYSLDNDDQHHVFQANGLDRFRISGPLTNDGTSGTYRLLNARATAPQYTRSATGNVFWNDLTSGGRAPYWGVLYDPLLGVEGHPDDGEFWPEATGRLPRFPAWETFKCPSAESMILFTSHTVNASFRFKRVFDAQTYGFNGLTSERFQSRPGPDGAPIPAGIDRGVKLFFSDPAAAPGAVVDDSGTGQEEGYAERVPNRLSAVSFNIIMAQDAPEAMLDGNGDTYYNTSQFRSRFADSDLYRHPGRSSNAVKIDGSATTYSEGLYPLGSPGTKEYLGVVKYAGTGVN